MRVLPRAYFLILTVCVAACSLFGDEPSKKNLKTFSDNSNAIIKQHQDTLKFSCSSYWRGWEPARAFDQDPLKSWFTARGDAAAFNKKPWIAVEFPVAVNVRRVTLLANQEPPWEEGYTILVGKLELIGKDNEVLYSFEDEVGGSSQTMEVRPKNVIQGVSKLRFRSLADEGDQNPYDDIGLAEILVE